MENSPVSLSLSLSIYLSLSLSLSLFPLLFSPSNVESHRTDEALKDVTQGSHVTYGEIKVNNPNMALV